MQMPGAQASAAVRREEIFLNYSSDTPFFIDHFQILRDNGERKTRLSAVCTRPAQRHSRVQLTQNVRKLNSIRPDQILYQDFPPPFFGGRVVASKVGYLWIIIHSSHSRLGHFLV